MKFKTLPTIVTETAQCHLAWGSEAVQKRRGVTRGHEALPGRKALFPALNLVRVAWGTWRPKGVHLQCVRFTVCRLPRSRAVKTTHLVFDQEEEK